MPTPIALGAFISGAPWDADIIDDFADLCGKMPSIVAWYQNWSGGFAVSAADAVATRGATPVLTWEPWEFSIKSIGEGHHDAYIHGFAQAVVSWGQPIGIRFAHEMNGDWYPWSVGAPDSSPARYIAAWQRIHQIFQSHGADNVFWIWCPNCDGPYSRTSSYPGDAFVDYIGIDGYNWGPTQTWGSQWQSFAQVFGAAYAQLTAFSSKPVIIAEVASTETGGSKAAWINQMATQIPAQLPRVRAVLWFHENKEQDWRINSSPSARQAFAQVAQLPAFSGEL